MRKLSSLFIAALCAACGSAGQLTASDAAIASDMPVVDGALAGDSAPQGDGSLPDLIADSQTGNDGFFVTVPPGTVVARLRTENPEQASFVLRGTIPIPPGGFPRADGKTPFAVADSDGTIVPAQVQIVSRYANAADGADVVELVARVKAHAGVNPGTVVDYDVVYSPYQGPAAPPANANAATFLKATPGLPGTVKTLLNDPNALVIRAEDVDGNVYELPLLEGAGSNKALGSGPFRHSYRTYGTMQLSQTGANPSSACQPLSHLFGVHAYFRAYDGEEHLLVDLRINNGPSDQDKGDTIDDPLGTTAYRSIELLIPSGWTAMQWPNNASFNPSAGPAGNYTVVELVKPESSGKMHVLPPRGQYHRRLAIVKSGAETRAQAMLASGGRGFAVAGQNAAAEDFFSWQNAATARYLATRLRMPSLEHVGRTKIVNKFQGLLGNPNQTNSLLWSIVSGQKGNGSKFKYNQMGIGHLLAGQYGGVTGGGDIDVSAGFDAVWAASTLAYRFFEAYHWAYNNRQPTAYYDKAGEPAQVEDMTVNGSLPFSFYNVVTGSGPNPFGYGKVKACQINHVKSSGKAPWYVDLITQYDQMDLQHQIRYTRNAKFLAWIGNDELAKDDLKREAAISDLSNPGVQGGGLKSNLNKTINKPNSTIFAGRGDAWGMDTMASYYALADDQWRAQKLYWFEMWADVVSGAQADCSAHFDGGFITGKFNNKTLQSTGETYIRIQTWEEMLLDISLRATVETVLRGVDPVRVSKVEDVIRRSNNMLTAPVAFAQWSNMHSTVKIIAVAYKSGPFAPFCTPGQLPGNAYENFVDPYYTAAAFGTAYAVTGDATYLDKAATTWSKNTIAGLHTWLENQQLSQIDMRLPLLAAVRSELGLE